MPRPRAHPLALGALVTVALALRLPALDRLPNPCGDEGNWAWYGRELAAGRAVALDPDARFVSLAFARAIALSIKLFGVSFGAVRAPLVAGVAAGMLVAWALARRLGAPRAGLALAALLAVHPWSVMWSRTATVPYALALPLALCATLALLLAARGTSPWRWSLAGALFGAGMHLTPLALLPALAAGGFLLAHRRALARTRGPWIALAVASLTAAPVVWGALHVARQGATRPRHFFTLLGDRLAVYLRTLLGSLSGDATLRHFVGPRPSLAAELLAIGGCAALLGLAMRDDARDDDLARDLARLTRWTTGTALLGTALLLAPARTWNLPAIDAERYGFTLLGPFALALATLSLRARTRHLPWVACALLLAGPTRATLSALHRGAGADHGFWTLAGGGGYRGWKTSASQRPLPVEIARAVDDLRAGAPATVVVADYAFHTLPFATGDAPVESVDVSKSPLPQAFGRVHVFVRWADGLLAPGFTPTEDVAANDALTALMRSPRFSDLRLVRRITQRDGAALVELWRATPSPHGAHRGE